MNQEKTLTLTQRELATALRSKLNDDDAYIGTMLSLILDQPNPDENCRELLAFIQDNPQAGYNEILLKADEIIGIEDPFTDDE